MFFFIFSKYFLGWWSPFNSDWLGLFYFGFFQLLAIFHYVVFWNLFLNFLMSWLWMLIWIINLFQKILVWKLSNRCLNLSWWHSYHVQLRIMFPLFGYGWRVFIIVSIWLTLISIEYLILIETLSKPSFLHLFGSRPG